MGRYADNELNKLMEEAEALLAEINPTMYETPEEKRARLAEEERKLMEERLAMQKEEAKQAEEARKAKEAESEKEAEMQAAPKTLDFEPIDFSEENDEPVENVQQENHLQLESRFEETAVAPAVSEVAEEAEEEPEDDEPAVYPHSEMSLEQQRAFDAVFGGIGEDPSELKRREKEQKKEAKLAAKEAKKAAKEATKVATAAVVAEEIQTKANPVPNEAEQPTGFRVNPDDIEEEVVDSTPEVKKKKRKPGRIPADLVFPTILISVGCMIYMEAVAHFALGGELNITFLYPMIFSAGIGLISSLLFTIGPKRLNVVFLIIYYLLIGIYFDLQLMYDHLFHQFIRFSEGFYAIRQIFLSKENIFAATDGILIYLILMFLPLIVWMLAGLLVPTCVRGTATSRLLSFVIGVLLLVGGMFLLERSGYEENSPYTNFYNYSTEATSHSAGEQVGLTAVTGLEIRQALPFGKKAE